MTDDQQVVIVTGASRGLGETIAQLVAERGARVVITARSSDALNAVANRIREQGGEALTLAGDIREPVVCRSLVELAIAQFGHIDAIVNNAGVLEPLKTVAEADADDWQYNWSVNVLGPLMLIRAALPYLRQQRGRVINVSSGAAVNPQVAWGAYNTAKAALNMLTKVVALEEPAVTAIALRPGAVNTAMQNVIRADGGGQMTNEAHQRFVRLHAEGELLPPGRPGRAIAALALHAPPDWSGEFIEWDEHRVQALIESN